MYLNSVIPLISKVNEIVMCSRKQLFFLFIPYIYNYLESSICVQFLIKCTRIDENGFRLFIIQFYLMHSFTDLFVFIQIKFERIKIHEVSSALWIEWIQLLFCIFIRFTFLLLSLNNLRFSLRFISVYNSNSRLFRATPTHSLTLRQRE